MEKNLIPYPQIVPVSITANATGVAVSTELDSSYDQILGIAVEFGESATANLLNATTLQSDMMIDGVRILPAGYDLKRLVSGNQIDLCERYYCLSKDGKPQCYNKGAKLETNVITNSTAFSAFGFKFYLILQRSESIS